MQNAARLIFLLFLLFSASFCFAQSAAPEATASISGRVTIDGKPARGIIVQAMPYLNRPQPPTTRFPWAISFPQTTTDASGYFRLTDLPSGRYIVMPFMTAMVGAYKINDSIERGLITLKEGAAIEGIDFALTRGGVITGRITYEDGSPVIGSEVFYAPEPIKDFSKPQFFFSSLRREEVKTDDRGSYRIYGLPEGRYKISLSLSPRSQRAFFFPGTTDYKKAIGVEVINGGETSGVDIRLGAPEKLYTVSGRVIEVETGKPLFGVPLVCIDSSSDEQYEITSNKNGEFIFNNLPSGSYWVYLLPSNQAEIYSETIRFEVQDSDIKDVEIKTHKSMSISGTAIMEEGKSVTEYVKRQPIVLYASSTQIKNDRTNYEASAHSSSEINPNGSFILKGLGPGSVNLYLRSSINFALIGVERNGRDVRNSLKIHQGEDINDIRVILVETDSEIRGKVAFEGGSLPDGAMLYISACRVRGERRDPYDYRFCSDGGVVDVDGRFTIDRLMAGQYELTLIAEVYKKGRIDRWITKQKVSIESRQTAETIITLDLNVDKEK